MAKIQEPLKSPDKVIDYQKVIADHPWIIQKRQSCIIDPDSDGLLCGLFMSNLLNWHVDGFYDGKILLLKKGLTPTDCIFVDREIFRDNVKSIGHHMVLFNKNQQDISNWWTKFARCIHPNNMRKHDFWKTYKLKYPLATIHLIMGIVSTVDKINVPKSAICPLLFTDGTWMNLFEYTENSLDWIRYLRAKDVPILRTVFCNKHYSVHTMMVGMNEFLEKRNAICPPRERGNRERGDRLIISTVDGPFNIRKHNGKYSVADEPKERVERFLKLLSSLTHWDYKPSHWSWDNLSLRVFTKKIFKKSSRLSNRNFEKIIRKNPLSYAISSNQRIEYTLEKPDKISD
jgi:hypothetical protein